MQHRLEVVPFVLMIIIIIQCTVYCGVIALEMTTAAAAARSKQTPDPFLCEMDFAEKIKQSKRVVGGGNGSKGFRFVGRLIARTVAAIWLAGGQLRRRRRGGEIYYECPRH